MKKIIISPEAQVKEVYSVLSKNYSGTMTDFLEMQRSWLHRSYLVFNDLDKYLILMSLFSKTFQSYSEYFIKYDFDQFHSIDEYELKKFSIVDVSKELSISKETTRRKILELEKNGLIKKNKKSVLMQKFAYSIKKPDLSIIAISRFLSNLSKLLKENKIIKNQISTRDFESLIKKNFSQWWNYFIVFQIQYLTELKKKFFGDFETLSIWAMIIYNQNLSYIKKLKEEPKYTENLKESYLDEVVSMTGVSGLNAMSIADLTGIPRPTVIRKLNKLVKLKWVKREYGLFTIKASNKNLQELNEIKTRNIGRISEMACKLFNTHSI